ncbi:hypothetical protein EO98_01540 [Methanosarcina sp. 2.H.T.1A.6]|uniref:hypothetical protein n=1 Tax=unclassified Methanosarcina TaxID=2644672 RepID=UPI0006224A66|nr:MULTISPECIES: hypothetical protein [unclassified Methanosarcina]KKG15939.1 hypothetical protein EO94_10990 [Methanosarcina sp. 2.H.T.1A.3]KKG18814.1 hypothetical protein EO97_19140 [Methanosarcina sp. 2.H.T.1A.15]KKG21078.1 hypothetical protein EO98_01540 [Methanosarcina sp. 2.H.T.1A.6]KKG23824.1 hypothetical protein EO96_07250 [Methanosarcina sp. 2.H.T.1A.8]
MWETEGLDIYMHDLFTCTETPITNESIQEYPAIYGNRTFWDDYRNGNGDIYMCTISRKKQGSKKP